jgi:hypothetical protein
MGGEVINELHFDIILSWQSAPLVWFHFLLTYEGGYKLPKANSESTTLIYNKL